MELDDQELKQVTDKDRKIRMGGKNSDSKSNNGLIQTEDYLEKLYLKMKTNSLLSSLVISIFLYAGEAWAFNKDLEQCFLALANEDVTGRALHHAYHDQREDTQESCRAHWEV